MRPASATDTAPTKVSAMNNPKSISDTRSTGLSTGSWVVSSGWFSPVMVRGFCASAHQRATQCVRESCVQRRVTRETIIDVGPALSPFNSPGRTRATDWHRHHESIAHRHERKTGTVGHDPLRSRRRSHGRGNCLAEGDGLRDRGRLARRRGSLHRLHTDGGLRAARLLARAQRQLHHHAGHPDRHRARPDRP